MASALQPRPTVLVCVSAAPALPDDLIDLYGGAALFLKVQLFNFQAHNRTENSTLKQNSGGIAAHFVKLFRGHVL